MFHFFQCSIFVTQHFTVPVWLQAYGTVSFGSLLLALRNHPHMVTTWAPSYPKLRRSSKCVLQSICDNCFLQMWEAPPAHDSFCNARCDCQKNKNICICMFKLGMHVQMTHKARCVWQNHRRFCVQPLVQELEQIGLWSLSSAMSLVSQPGALVTSGCVSGLVLPPRTLNQCQTNRWDSLDTP